MAYQHHPDLSAAIECLAPDMKLRLREIGLADRGAILWPCLFDDKSNTRIVDRAYKQNAAKCFSLLWGTELRDGPVEMRFQEIRKSM